MPSASDAALVQLEPTAPRPTRPARKPGRIVELDVDWSLAPAELILPCTPPQQARGLGWTATEVRAVNRTSGLYDYLPRTCDPDSCHWSSRCPTREHDYPFEGLGCPLDVMYIWRQFARLVRELNIQPDDYVDLSHITDLVRIDLQIHHCDQQLQAEGLDYDQEVITGGREKLTTKTKTVHPMVALQRGLRSDRTKLYQRLIADRAEKAKEDRLANRKEANILSFLELARNGQGQGRVTEQPPRTLPSPDPPEDPDCLDAEFTED